MGQLSGLWLDDSRIYLVRPDTERGRVCVMEVEMFTVPDNEEQTRATKPRGEQAWESTEPKSVPRRTHLSFLLFLPSAPLFKSPSL